MAGPRCETHLEKRPFANMPLPGSTQTLVIITRGHGDHVLVNVSFSEQFTIHGQRGMILIIVASM